MREDRISVRMCSCPRRPSSCYSVSSSSAWFCMTSLVHNRKRVSRPCGRAHIHDRGLFLRNCCDQAFERCIRIRKIVSGERKAEWEVMLYAGLQAGGRALDKSPIRGSTQCNGLTRSEEKYSKPWSLQTVCLSRVGPSWKATQKRKGRG